MCDDGLRVSYYGRYIYAVAVIPYFILFFFYCASSGKNSANRCCLTLHDTMDTQREKKKTVF